LLGNAVKRLFLGKLWSIFGFRFIDDEGEDEEGEEKELGKKRKRVKTSPTTKSSPLPQRRNLFLLLLARTIKFLRRGRGEDLRKFYHRLLGEIARSPDFTHHQAGRNDAAAEASPFQRDAII